MLPPNEDPNLLVGTSTADDAGVYKLTDDIALVQTVDIFTPVVDDPYDYGQIAAANSLSDVYAMGGKPLTALNIVGFPKKTVDLEVLAEILKGSADKVKEAECTVAGGHTVVDDELKFGLSVTGVVHPDRIMMNAGARPGDKLILTKPLGMGILSTALKNGKLPEEIIKKITVIMAELNKTAAEAMDGFNVNSVTDITGFGLMGHANEMASGSNVSMVLDAGSIPYLREAYEMTKEGGYIPGGSTDNKNFLSDKVTFTDNIDDHERIIFFDAQTSGGLLISIGSESADEYLALLHERGIEYAAIIGEVIEMSDVAIRVEK
ncbi:MAG: selenide, water dikinase SelD [bacterium]|nr:selenide, water dikinase SelD [bacterium]